MMLILVVTSRRLQADSGTCGGVTTGLPFTDIAGNAFFCQIAEAFFSGLTNGTTTTTYSPSDNVTREQMSAFITRTQDSALMRGSRRAALNQWETPSALPMTGRTAVGEEPSLVASDGVDIWVADNVSGDVKRVHASDGSLLGTWTAAHAFGVLVTRGQIYVTGTTSPGVLYVIDPGKSPQAATILSSSLGNFPQGIATDGFAIWTANFTGHSVSRFDPASGSLSNITTGFSQPVGVLFDGAYIWVTDWDGTLKKLDTRNGEVLQSVSVGSGPSFPGFDGSNIWVPNSGSQSLTVVRARDGLVLATLTGNGLLTPIQAAFDGQRILVTNNDGDSVSLWRATDLKPIGSFPAPGAAVAPAGACSDGINFWITLIGADKLARF